MRKATTVRPWYTNHTASAWRCDPPTRSASEFHRTLPGYAPTPLVEVPGLAVELGIARLFVKDESTRFDLSAFKFLGASWAIHRALQEQAAITALTCATDGNHGRAVARIAATRGVPAVIFMPRAVPPLVVGRIAAEGAEVSVLDTDYDGAVLASRRWAAEHHGALVVQDTAWEGYEDVPGWIVEGYSTIFAELDDQLAVADAPSVSLVVAPAGVGSLAQAAIAHYRSRTGQHHPRLLVVEPDTAACILASLRDGKLESVPTADTIMNGLNCGTPSTLAWPYLRDGLDGVTVVTDAQCRAAMADLDAHGVSSGPSGAAAFAGTRALARLANREPREALSFDRDAVVVCLSTEGALR